MHTFLQIVLLIVGFIMLVKGADWFVEGASEAAERLGIPQLVIGLTIVAMGTSAPEAAISISAAAKHSADIAVGNVLGSNILNILLILGITAVITPLAVKKSTVKYEIPFVVAISVLMALLGLIDGKMGRIDGIVLWGCFILYMAYLLKMAKKDPEPQSEKEKIEETLPKAHFSVLKIVILIIVGVALIIFGSNITVDAATELARIIGVNERIIGLTIVAFGTSLPELVTCVVAGLKKKADIAIGNIVGSNIFNVLFVLGTSAIITNIPYQSGFLIDSIVAVAAALFLWLLVLRKKKLSRVGGVIMLIGYAAFFVYLIMG